MAWGGELVFDCVIVTLTLYKAIKLGRMGRRTLLDIILRDGTFSPPRDPALSSSEQQGQCTLGTFWPSGGRLRMLGCDLDPT